MTLSIILFAITVVSVPTKRASIKENNDFLPIRKWKVDVHGCTAILNRNIVKRDKNEQRFADYAKTKKHIHWPPGGQGEPEPGGIAITTPGRGPLTYRQLNHQINRIVATLNSIGIGRDDRIAIVLPNGPEMAVAFLGVAAGAPPPRRSIPPIAPPIIFVQRSR